MSPATPEDFYPLRFLIIGIIIAVAAIVIFSARKSGSGYKPYIIVAIILALIGFFKFMQ